ncbi:MAG: glycoside hydrolase family 99-like domain-containing protein [Ignavibacteria bacterium]|jgi:hypothetical protein
MLFPKLKLKEPVFFWAMLGYTLTNINRAYEELIDDVVKDWNSIDSEYDIPCYPHVSIGWDNNPRFEMFREGIVKNNTPGNFEKALRKAKDFADSHANQVPLITINSLE